LTTTKRQLQASVGERKDITIEDVNKQNKAAEKYTKNLITKNYIT
jgi:hypothetical protein